MADNPDWVFFLGFAEGSAHVHSKSLNKENRPTSIISVPCPFDRRSYQGLHRARFEGTLGEIHKFSFLGGAAELATMIDN